MPALAGDILEYRFKGCEIFRPLGVVSEKEIGKEPFAEQGPLLTEAFIQWDADPVGKQQVQVVGFDPQAMGFEQCRERAELNRGVLGIAEGHVDERYGCPVAHINAILS